MSEAQDTLEKKLLSEFEEIEKIKWLSENTIQITLKYPARPVQLFLANPTVEKVKEKITEIRWKEISDFVDLPEGFPRYEIGSVEEIEVKREESED